jgi:hypothetical protein
MAVWYVLDSSREPIRLLSALNTVFDQYPRALMMLANSQMSLGDCIPGLERMTVEDEDALFVWLVQEKLDYAFEWEGGRQGELRDEVGRCVRAATRGQPTQPSTA